VFFHDVFFFYFAVVMDVSVSSVLTETEPI